MKISHRATKFANTCTVSEMTWEQLIAWLSTYTHVPKEDAQMWLAGESLGGCKNENVAALSAVVFDIDHMNIDQFEVLIKNFELSGIEIFVHSSYSHSDENISLRTVVRTSRPILPKEYLKVREMLEMNLQFTADKATKNNGRWYFVPNMPEGTDLYSELFPGQPYNVDEALAQKTRAVLEDAPKVVPDVSVDMGDLWKQIRNMDMALCATLEQALPLGSRGEMHNTIHHTAARLVWKFGPSVPEAAVFQIMRPSLENTGDADVAKEHALQSIAHARKELELKVAEEAEERAQKAQVVIEERVKHIPKEIEIENGQYSGAQLQRFAEENNCTVEEFTKRWIIHLGKMYYVFTNGTYKGPVTKDDLLTVLPRDLALAPIDLSFPTKNGPERAKAVNDLIRDHGTCCNKGIVASLSAQKSYYDAASEKFYEAICPINPRLVPTYNAEVDEFIKCFGETVYNWCSVVTRLSKPSALLFICAPKNVGKSLLATAIASIWGARPTDMAGYVSDFNDDITSCPLVFGDEGFPEMDNQSLWVRKETGNASRKLKRKHKDTATLEGYTRLLVCANNSDSFKSSTQLSIKDAQAFGERIAYVHLGENSLPRQFIIKMQNKKFDFDNNWIHSGVFAEHLLWMRDNHKFEFGERYLVQGTPSDFHNRLLLSTGIVNNVCEWFLRYLHSPKLLPPKVLDNLIMHGNNHLIVAVDAVAESERWKQFCPNTGHSPTASRIGGAIRAISKCRYETEDHTYYSVDLSLLYTAGRQLGLVNHNILKNRLEAHNQKLSDVLAKAKQLSADLDGDVHEE